jgi:hypothetical protein
VVAETVRRGCGAFERQRASQRIFERGKMKSKNYVATVNGSQLRNDIIAARWFDHDRGLWRVATADGRTFVAAAGQFEPSTEPVDMGDGK